MVSSELQRQLPLTTQIQLLKATGLIDDLFISSSLVDIQDLKAAAEVFFATIPRLAVTRCLQLKSPPQTNRLPSERKNAE